MNAITLHYWYIVLIDEIVEQDSRIAGIQFTFLVQENEKSLS